MSGSENFNINNALLQRLKYEHGMGLEALRPTKLEINTAPPPNVTTPSAQSSEANLPPPQATIASPAPALATFAPTATNDPWSALETSVTECMRCPLHDGRIQPIFGEGDRNAEIVFIGGGPGREEDECGHPLIGPTGELFDRILKAVGWSRAEVYICNLIKCYPTKGHRVSSNEIKQCSSFLEQQIALIKPRVLITFGAPAAHALIGAKGDIRKLRGKWGTYSKRGQTIQLMPTYHPAYVNQNYTDANRRAMWNDMKQVKSFLDQPSS